MKRHLALTAIFMLIGVVLTIAGAQAVVAAPQAPSGFTALAPIPGLTDKATSVVNAKDFSAFFNSLYRYLIGLAAVLAIIEIIWGGLEISTKDSVSKQSDGKSRITQAIFGLILVLSPVLVFTVINPSILNLSVAIPPLKTIPPGENPTNNTPSPDGGAPIPNNALPVSDTECRTVSTNEYFENAVCPNIDTALAYPCKNGGTLVARYRPLECKNYDSNLKKCLDTYPVQCMGAKTATVLYYAPTSYIKDLLGLNFGEGDIKVIPRDIQIYNDFNSACVVAGGRTAHELIGGSESDCPSDAQLPIVRTTNQDTPFVCASFKLLCSVFSS